jgi:tetratricopeptide (TPR) repeat protein
MRRVIWLPAFGATSGLAVAMGLTPLPAFAQSGRPLVHNIFDENTVRTLRARKPQEAELLDRGEALAKAGDLAGALALFERGRAGDPDQTLFARRACEVLAAMGRTADAVAACFHALEGSDSAMNARATVRALMSGPSAPTLDQVMLALTIANREARRAPGTLPTAAAMCDIAERIGDGVMLEHCADEVNDLDPHSSEASLARSILASRCPPVRFWFGWSALCAAILGTLAHVLWISRTRRGRVVAAAAFALALLSAASRPSLADEPGDRATKPHITETHDWLSKWPVDDDHPDEHIPTEAQRDAEPLEFGYWLQDLALKAARASKKGDHAASIRFWGALAKAVPDRAVALTKICDEYETIGDRENAVKACGAALLRDGLTLADYTHYVHLLLGKPGALKPDEIASLGEVLEHMKQDPAGRDAAVSLECDVGTKTGNIGQLQECTAALTAMAPNDPKTLTYRWALAMQMGQIDEARALIQQARQAGMQPEAVDRMERALSARRWRFAIMAVGAAVAFAAALALLVSRIRRRAAAPHPA